MGKSLSSIDLIRIDRNIKKGLKQRFEELGLSYGNIVSDAMDYGYTKLTKANLSLYFNRDLPVANYPTQETIIWLCLRYGIKIKIQISWEEKEYDEDKCLERLKSFFG